MFFTLRHIRSNRSEFEINNLELYQSYFHNFIEYLQVSSYSPSAMNVYCPGARTFLMLGRISVALVFSGMVKR